MKPMSVWSKALLILTLAASTSTLSAAPPTTPPPRGNAYGYYLKNGGQLLVLEMEEDGSRLIDLSKCRPRTEYVLEASEDLVNWNAIAILRIGSDGTASYLDSAPMAYCFYRVKRVR